MKRTAFSLIEILVAVIILAVLSSLSIVAYQKTLQANDERICQQNQKVLQAAIEVYTIENDAVPATLAMLNPRQINLAYLKVVGQPKENKLLAFFKTTLGIKTALAQSIPSLEKYYNYEAKIRRCPADKTSSTNPQYTSYSLNPIFDNDEDLKDTANENKALIYDTDAYHKKALSSDTYQVAITPKGEYKEQTKKADGTIVNNNDDIPSPEITDENNDGGEGRNDTTASGFTATADNCCFPGDNCKAQWAALTGEQQKACKEAGYNKCGHGNKAKGNCNE